MHKAKKHHKHRRQSHKHAPKAHTLAKYTTYAGQGFHLDVPIDEVDPIGIQVEPTHSRDTINSVTLKSFRKVLGYDTFNSILKKERDETKDTNDYYNVTVSMMITRVPIPSAAATPDAYNGGSTIADKLDKGFPYDDGDGTIDDAVPAFKKKAPAAAVNVAVLNEQNITKGALKNLINDATSPVTQELVQLEGSDGDNVSALFDCNVTRGALKNLITDKPAPITVKLA